MMASAAVKVHGSSQAAAAAAMDHHRREVIGGAGGLTGMRRSRSAPQLWCSLAVPRVAAPPSLKTSRSVGMFPLGSILTSTIRSFLFEPERGGAEEEVAAGAGITLVDHGDEIGEDIAAPAEEADKSSKEKRANWVARIVELRRRWRGRQHKAEEQQQQGGCGGGGEEEEEKEEEAVDGYCRVSYDSEEEEEGRDRVVWDQESFASLLERVSWSEAELLSQLSFLCNKAYEIQDINVAELEARCKLQFITSSLEKKWDAAVRAKLETDSTQPQGGGVLGAGPLAEVQNSPPARPVPRAYEVAASAASYVHSRAKGLLSLGSREGTHAADSPDAHGKATETPGPNGRGYKYPEVAAYVAASTMTAVVAAEEGAKQEAAKDLRSLHSSPCEWFVCDRRFTRCFVIQGSDSLASWQANLFFEPTKFEGIDVLVHRGIYEAAKGIYEQFLPEIQEHLSRHGDRARFRFTGHSLGGSLCLLVALMLLARGDLDHRHLHPVVTFGSPSVFCGGERVLDVLGLDETFVRSVVMHRDIVPRAFSCDYPNHVAHVLKRLNGAFRSHPCLNNQKVLYSPLGKTYILQPGEESSPSHHLLPPGAALYVLNGKNTGASASKSAIRSALQAFINSPHPLETLSDHRAYGSEGTILRDHDSSNYGRAIGGLVRQHNDLVRRRRRKQRPELWWPLPTNPATISLPSRSCGTLQRRPVLEKPVLVATKVMTTGGLRRL